MRRNTYDAASGTCGCRLHVRKRCNRWPTITVRCLATMPPWIGCANSTPCGPACCPTPRIAKHWRVCVLSAWAAADRPGEPGSSYTSNWPHEPLVGNTPTAGTGHLVDRQRDPDDWRHCRHGLLPCTWSRRSRPRTPADPLFTLQPTPSMRATRKYFCGDRSDPGPDGHGCADGALRGGGTSFFGLPLAQVLPLSSAARSTPSLPCCGSPPPGWPPACTLPSHFRCGTQVPKLGVDVLFLRLLFIVVGATATGWIGQYSTAAVTLHSGSATRAGVHQHGTRLAILLFVGLLFWVFLLGRGLMPALRKPSESRGLIAMVFCRHCALVASATSLTWAATPTTP